MTQAELLAVLAVVKQVAYKYQKPSRSAVSVDCCGACDHRSFRKTHAFLLVPACQFYLDIKRELAILGVVAVDRADSTQQERFGAR